MRKSLLFLVLAFVAINVFGFNPPLDKPLKYVDAREFQVINRGFNSVEPMYTRIPDALKDMCYPETWRGLQDATGVGIRFRTNTKVIGVRYNLKFKFGMTWQAYTGIRGTDLYILGEDDNEWHYINTSRPTNDSIIEKCYTKDMDGQMHEFLIYLPLYDGINWLEIGVDSTATIAYPAVENPILHKRIVFYGTSVLQGGCASRPGMTQTTILQRELGLECVNVGISGNGNMRPKNAEVLAAMEDVICYVIDPLMNCTHTLIDTGSIAFIRTIHDAHPDVPIIMVAAQNPVHPFRENGAAVINKTWYNRYEQLKAEGIDNLYYVHDTGFTGKHEAGTVDGSHFTDYGFQCYAEILLPHIKRALGQITIVGHRGSWKGVENTLDAFKFGVESGYTALETDVRITKDNHFVCWHDGNLKECGLPKVVIADTKLQKLQKLDLTQKRAWGETFTGKLCTFEEYLDFCKANKVTPVIELKWTRGITETDLSNLPQLVQIVKDRGMMHDVIFISFMKAPLQWIRDNESADVKLQFLCYAHTERASFEWMKANHIDLDVCKGFSKEMVERYHKAGLKVNCWTIDDEPTFEEALYFGVDMVTTNKIPSK